MSFGHKNANGKSSPGDEWETPPALFDRMELLCRELTGGARFGMDVCASMGNAKPARIGFWTKDDDALSKAPALWATQGPCWMNPPYSDPGPWLEQAKWVQRCGGVLFALIPAALETAYFRNSVTGIADKILILSRRIRFVGATASAKGPNVVAIYRPHLGDTRWVPFEITTEEAGNNRKK